MAVFRVISMVITEENFTGMHFEMHCSRYRSYAESRTWLHKVLLHFESMVGCWFENELN